MYGRNRQGPSNPATPSSVGGQPTSYKTNVNRAKTKRWVEAPSYSYDGDDWGEVDDCDEYGGYDEPSEPSEPPRATGFRQRGQSINQAPASGYDGSRGPQQELTNDGRRAYGDMSGQLPVQQHNHGSLNATNPGQPYHSVRNARSNSFDRGDESRAFSAGGAQHRMGPASDATAPVHQEQNPGFTTSQTSHAPNVNPAFAPQGSYGTPIPHPQSSRQGPPGPPLQVQTGSNVQGPARNVDQALSPAASYRGVAYSEQGRRPSSGSRAQSMTSNTSSLDFHGRRDFSPSAVPQPLHPYVSAGPQSANEVTQFPPRESSLSQQGPRYASIGHEMHPAAEGSDEDSSPLNPVAGNDAKPLPFVRPADIYKRMEEERERERRSQDSARPSMEAIMRKSTDREASPIPSNPAEQSRLEGAGRPSRLQNSLANTDFTDSNQRPDTTIDPATQRQREHGMFTNNHPTSTQYGIGNDAPRDFTPLELEHSSAPSKVMLDHSVLPNVSRVSGFGESFFKPLESAQAHESRDLGIEPPAPLPSSNNHLSPSDATIGSLQHQPSLGFRTVVRQAFDDQVPPTPSSLADSSVARTNSESTSGVSPIMSRGPSVATAQPMLKDREAMLGGTRKITEAVDEDSSRPISGSTIGPPKPNERKPSPSLVKSGESGAVGQPASHRRNLSTPSPVSSPARTAALEVNRPMRRPQEVELAMATPIEAHRGNGQEFPLWKNARDHDQRGGTDYTTREADIASIVNESVEGPTPIAANAVKDARSSFLESRRSNNIESPTAPVASPSTLRAESPGKNRVRDLAGMFESGSHSKSGSESSSPLRGNSFGANTLSVDDAASRPAAGRLESFRPRLPGGWESFASTAPSIAPYVSNNGKERGTSATPAADANNTTLKARGQDTNDDIDVTPTTVKRGLTKSEHDYHGRSASTLEDPFSAVAAAGSALAGALAAAVGLGNGEDATDKEPETDTKSDPDPVAEDFGAARGRSASLQNTAITPEASKTTNRLPTTSSVSSGAPTPPLKDTPLVGHEPAPDAGYFAPIEPLKNRPRSQITTSDQATPLARPPMLPYMSTDVKPQDLESDRLRKEIVRSLSPVTYTKPEPNVETPSSLDHPLSNNASLGSQSHDSMVIPSEYDSYWNEPNSEDGLSPRPSEYSDYPGHMPPVNHPQVLALAENLEQSPLSRGHNRALSAPGHEQQHTEENMPTPPAALTHRFSWEQEPAAVAAGSGVETLGHPQKLGTNAHVISDQTRGERETALYNPQKATEFQESQSPTPRDVSNAEDINQATSELPATEQEWGTGLAGHTMNRWGPAAVTETGNDMGSQHSGLYNVTNQARGHVNNPETVDGPVVGQLPTPPDTRREATHMQSSHDPYSNDLYANDPYANEPYAQNARSLPTHHGFEGQSSEVQPFDTHESSPQPAFERLPSDAQALNYQEASPQQEPEDLYGEAQATESLLSTSLQHGTHDPMNIADNQDQYLNAQRDNLPPLPPPPPGAQPRIPAFREILALHTAADRIRAYNAAREQFANMNTGLDHWITVTASETPEHAGLLPSIDRPSIAPASLSGTPTRGKLSGLRPPGAQATQQPYYQQYLNASSQPTTPGSATASPGYSELSDRPNLPSSGGSGRVQAKGKDLLKNAGVFGGKANVAAKGLFSKGKSRFRSSGGGDKVEK